MTLLTQITADLNTIFEAGLTLDIIHTYGEETETLKAFFDNPYQSSLNDQAENQYPSVLIRESETTNIDKDSTFTINSVVYNIIEIQKSSDQVYKYLLSEDDD